MNQNEHTSTNRLKHCEVCNSEEAKYTCPRCEVRTCCLGCVDIHKKELDCNGIRDPTKFITMDQFTNIDLLNDYRMLENVGRIVDGLHKSRGPHKRKFDREKLPKYLFFLSRALKERDINIKFLPEGFERRKSNKSFVHRETKEVMWDIEWTFPNINNLKLHERGCSENKKLSSLVQKYLQTDSENRELKYYQSAGICGIVLYLKAENVKNGKYYELDLSQSLKENLKGKVIIEFPIIHVVLKGHESLYSIVDSSDEDEKEMKSFYKKKKSNEGQRVIQEILSEETNEGTKNLLFASEYSETDNSGDENM